jgi:hypothetical protein
MYESGFNHFALSLSKMEIRNCGWERFSGSRHISEPAPSNVPFRADHSRFPYKSMSTTHVTCVTHARDFTERRPILAVHVITEFNNLLARIECYLIWLGQSMPTREVPTTTQLRITLELCSVLLCLSVDLSTQKGALHQILKTILSMGSSWRVNVDFDSDRSWTRVDCWRLRCRICSN